MCGNMPEWLTPTVQDRLREIEYEFHVRVFGDEMARVNSLPLDERKAYIYDMIDFALSQGVKLEKEALGVTR
jgi:hypothetical protein